MSTLESWIDDITVFELLDSAPHGFMLGCGATSEFLAFVFRNRPSTIEDFFKFCRQHESFNSAINEQSFKPEELEDFLNELDKRLNLNEYARVSFILDEVESIPNNNDVFTSIFELVKNRPKPHLFDHSFVITKNGWRFESYIDQYAPRRVLWKNYRNDIKELFENPRQKWEEIFGVKCEPDYDLSKVQIIIHN